MQELDVDPSEHLPPQEADRGCVPGTLGESADPEPHPRPDGADPGQAVPEEVVSNQEPRGDAAAESFSVSEALRQTQLVRSFGPSVQVEMVPESKSRAWGAEPAQDASEEVGAAAGKSTHGNK